MVAVDVCVYCDPAHDFRFDDVRPLCVLVVPHSDVWHEFVSPLSTRAVKKKLLERASVRHSTNTHTLSGLHPRVLAHVT